MVGGRSLRYDDIGKLHGAPMGHGFGGAHLWCGRIHSRNSTTPVGDLSRLKRGVAIAINLVMTQWMSVTGGGNGLPLSHAAFGSLYPLSATTLYLGTLVLTLIGIYVSWRLTSGQWGRQLKAIRVSETAARTCGINLWVCQDGRRQRWVCLLGTSWRNLRGHQRIRRADLTSDLTARFCFSRWSSSADWVHLQVRYWVPS